MELLFAFVFVCNLQFRSCDFRVNPMPFKDPTSCVQQLYKDVQEAGRRQPHTIGDANHPQFEIFGLCRPAFKVRIKL